MLRLSLPKKIAVTGNIASGKSSVCLFFEKLGAFYVSADTIVHQLLVSTTPLGKNIIALLGADVVDGEKLNRDAIAQKIFNNPLLLKQCEKLIHPEVQKVIDTQYKAVSQTPIPLFIAEVPLLYEAGLENFYDKVIVVVSEEKMCMNRFRYDKSEYKRRAQRLMPIEEKIKKADIVIKNNGNLESLYQTIQPIFYALKENI